jgi:hypothetical protein
MSPPFLTPAFTALAASAALLGLSGCASDTVGQRKAERPAAYAALSADDREQVDRGQLREGMETNAVYLALGSPGEVLAGLPPDGTGMVWRYFRDRTRLAAYRQAVYTGQSGPTYETFYEQTAKRYLALVVVFEDGRVTRWRGYQPIE